MSGRRDVERDSIWNVSHIYFDSDSRKGTIHTHYFVPPFSFPSQLIPLFTMGWNNFWSKILYLISTIAFSQYIFLILFLLQKFILITRIKKFRKKDSTLEKTSPHCSIACNTIRSYFMWKNSKPCYSEANRLNIRLTIQFGRCFCSIATIEPIFDINHGLRPGLRTHDTKIQKS